MAVFQDTPSLPVKAPSLWLRVPFWICIVIAVAAVLRRVFALVYPSNSGPPQQAILDAAFASRTVLTLVHILPALAFVLLAPFAIFRNSGHKLWVDHLFFPLGAWVGFTAYAMSSFAVGGWIERSAVLVFNSLFLYSLFRAYRYGQSGNFRLKQRWLLRAVVILLGIATTRPVMGIFFATSARTHLEPSQFFGLAFWIGFPSIQSQSNRGFTFTDIDLRYRQSIYSLHGEVR